MQPNKEESQEMVKTKAKAKEEKVKIQKLVILLSRERGLSSLDKLCSCIRNCFPKNILQIGKLSFSRVSAKLGYKKTSVTCKL